MPINPNIALGIQPQQQPNMLGQLGQMMAIKAAQQEMEGNEGVRNALSRGAPEDPTQLLQYGKQGRATYESLLKGKKEQLESAEKRLTMAGQIAGYVRDNPTPENFVSAVGTMVQNGVLTRAQAERVIADAGTDPSKIKSYAERAASDALKEADRLTARTRIQAANIAAAAPLGQLELARAKDARSQQELDLVRGILTGSSGATTPPAAANAPMGGGGRLGSGTFGIPMGGAPTGAGTQPNVLATQVAPPVTTPAPVNALLNPPAGQTGVAPVTNRVDQITTQISQLAKIGGPVANQAIEGLVKEYNVLNPAGKIEIDSTGTLRTINERSGTSRVVTGADGQPVMGKVAPVTKDIVDPTDPSGKRMITVEVNTYKAGTGLGADGNQAAPTGVLGVATSQIQPNYLRDPNNPQGVIPVPGSAADPNAAVPSGYRKTATGFEFIPGGPQDPNAAVPSGYRRAPNGVDFEFIPGGPQDPAVQARQTSGKLSEKDLMAREAKFPQATSALNGFEAKTAKFERDIDELIANEKGLNEITGFLAGRTDLSALTREGRRALALFNTITAKGGFSELQDMRNASPTGGALGNVSNQEGKQLIDSVGALSRTQDANDLRKSLGILKTDLQGSKQRVREAYDLTYEYRAGRAPSGGGGGNAGAGAGGVIDFGSLK